MSPKLESFLAEAVSALRANLGENLFSCSLYGSAVRGNFIEGVSDINLLIILNRSDATAHRAVADAIGKDRKIDPFILGRSGLARSVRAFASKFSSIKRNYKVLHGADALADLKVEPELERFLCEQALRNIRLRLVYAFVRRSQTNGYHLFLARTITPLFVHISEILRLNGVSIPKDVESRIPIFEKELGIDGSVMRDLLVYKNEVRRLSDRETVLWHERVFGVIDRAVNVVEEKWAA